MGRNSGKRRKYRERKASGKQETNANDCEGTETEQEAQYPGNGEETVVGSGRRILETFLLSEDEESTDGDRDVHFTIEEEMPDRNGKRKKVDGSRFGVALPKRLKVQDHDKPTSIPVDGTGGKAPVRTTTQVEVDFFLINIEGLITSSRNKCHQLNCYTESGNQGITRVQEVFSWVSHSKDRSRLLYRKPQA